MEAEHQDLPPGASQCLGTMSTHQKDVPRESVTWDVGRKLLDVVRYNLPALAERAEKPVALDAPIEECYGLLPPATRIEVGELLRTVAQLSVVSGIPTAFFKARVIPMLVGKPNPGWPFKLFMPSTPRYGGHQRILVVHAGTIETLSHEIALGEDTFIGIAAGRCAHGTGGSS